MDRLTLFAASVAACVSASLFSGSLSGPPLIDAAAVKVFGGINYYDCTSSPCETPMDNCVLVMGTTNVYRLTTGTYNAKRDCFNPCASGGTAAVTECSLSNPMDCYIYRTCLNDCMDASCGEPSSTQYPTNCMTGGEVIPCPMS